MLPIPNSDQRSPSSAIRYRPASGKRPPHTAPPISRASRFRPPQPDVETEDRWPAADDTRETEEHFRTSLGRRKRRVHPLLVLGIGMLLTLLLWTGVNWVIAWGTDAINTMRFGYPRVSQTDAVVGHHDSAKTPSHFLAINLHGLVEVIEWPGGNAAQARVFLGPQLFGSDSDQQPVTLRFADLNGDGQLDMIVEIGTTRVVFLNDQGSFRSLRLDEQSQILSRLHQVDP